MKNICGVFVVSVALVCLTSCAMPLQRVAGASGKTYQAPTLCEALVLCLNGSENSCYYASDTIKNTDGSVVTSATCKEVKK